jgi:hypothetical protein
MPFHHLPGDYERPGSNFTPLTVLLVAKLRSLECDLNFPHREIQIEATSGFEPLNSSFAESCLATWLRRQIIK